jgi:CRISPR system Cascade subunit CasB
MHGFVVQKMPENLPPERQRPYYTVAALIAAQPPEARKTDTSREEASDKATTETEAKETAETGKPERRLNLGHSLAEAVNREDAKRRTMEKRLQLLARQGVDGVHIQLTPLVRYLREKQVPVDWSRLLEDLRRWPYDRDQVATEWLQAYFRTLIDPDFEADDEGPDNADDTDEADNGNSDNEE